MVKLFGIDIAAVVNKEIAPGLIDLSLTHYTAGSRSADDPTAGIVDRPTKHTGKGFRAEYKDRQIDGKQVLRGDRKILIVANSLSPAVAPVPGDKITLDSETTRIVEDGVSSDPATATYTCQVRAF